MKYVLILILASMLAACAAPSKQSTDQLDGVSQGVAQIAKEEGQVSLDDDRLVCTREKHLGSNIPKRICMTKGEREKARVAAQRRLENNQDDVDRVLDAAARDAAAKTPSGPNVRN